jgi:hypothetical protein
MDGHELHKAPELKRAISNFKDIEIVWSSATNMASNM